MRKLLSFITSTLLNAGLLVFVLITACAAPTSTPAEMSVVENTPPPTFTPIATAITAIKATMTIQPTPDLPTLAPSSALSGEVSMIQFDASGTFVDIIDSLGLGSSKTYSINAMKGQIMSISIVPQLPDNGWGYIPMQIKGIDGSQLCPRSADTECIFWRGALPSSQDYLVTLTPNVDVPQFVMRVAINPPGDGIQFFEYKNPATGLSITYPDTFAPALPVVGNYKTDPELTLNFIDTSAYDKPNLSEAYLFVSSTSDSQVVATCVEPYQGGGGPEQIVGNEVVNGFTFVHSTSEGAGAGNYYQQEVYRMVNEDVCYEVIYFVHSTNIGNYPPDTITEFDAEALMQELDSVFSTLTIEK